MALWTPAYLEQGASLWLDVSDASTVDLDTGAISVLRDKSGRDAHAYQSTAANRPTYTDWGTNGLKCASFDGSNDSLVGALSQTYTSKSLFVVARFPYLNATSKCFFVDWMTGDSITFDNVPFVLVTQYSPRTLRTNLNYYRLNISDNANLLASHVNTGAIISNRLNGTLSSEGEGGTTASSVYDTVSNYRIGGRNSATEYPMYGFIGEMIVLPYAASSDVRQKIEGYLAWKWGTELLLPEEHLYRNYAPVELADFRIVSLVPSIEGSGFKVEIGNGQITAPYSLIESSGSNQSVANGNIVSPSHIISVSADPITGDGQIDQPATSVSGLSRMQAYGDASVVMPDPIVSGFSIGQPIGGECSIVSKNHFVSSSGIVDAVGIGRVNQRVPRLTDCALLHSLTGHGCVAHPAPIINGYSGNSYSAIADIRIPMQKVSAVGAAGASMSGEIDQGMIRISSIGSGLSSSDSILRYNSSRACQA